MKMHDAYRWIAERQRYPSYVSAVRRARRTAPRSGSPRRTPRVRGLWPPGPLLAGLWPPGLKRKRVRAPQGYNDQGVWMDNSKKRHAAAGGRAERVA